MCAVDCTLCHLKAVRPCGTHVALAWSMDIEDQSSSYTESLDLAGLWRGFLSGHLTLADARHEQGRCVATLEHRSQVRMPPAIMTEMLERAFLGESQKSLALEYKVSGATVAANCANVLNAIAKGHAVSRAPVLLIVATHAAHGVPVNPALVDEQLDAHRWQISCEIPGSCFAPRLSPGERDVARMLIEGRKHVEIADLRGTSMRTTANQLASIFSKLGISGRAQLRSKAIIESAPTPRLLTTHEPLSSRTDSRLPSRRPHGMQPSLIGNQVLSAHRLQSLPG